MAAGDGSQIPGEPAAAEAACLAAAAHLRPPGAPDTADGLAAALAEVHRALAAAKGAHQGAVGSDARSPEPLMLLRLRLLQAMHPLAQRPPSGPAAAGGKPAVTAAAAEATALCPGSYAVWCAAANAQPRWQDATATLQRGIIAVAGAAHASQPANSQTSSGSMLAACLLDLALRLLATWTAAGQAADAAAWVSVLLRDAASLPALPAAESAASQQSSAESANAVSADQLPGAASRALLRGLAGQPESLAVLWLVSAHLTARGQLPKAVLHR